MFADQPEETDPDILAAAYKFYMDNRGNWKKLYPQCKIKYIPAVHWDIIEEIPGREIVSIMKEDYPL